MIEVTLFKRFASEIPKMCVCLRLPGLGRAHPGVVHFMMALSCIIQWEGGLIAPWRGEPKLKFQKVLGFLWCVTLIYMHT